MTMFQRVSRCSVLCLTLAASIAVAQENNEKKRPAERVERKGGAPHERSAPQQQQHEPHKEAPAQVQQHAAPPVQQHQENQQRQVPHQQQAPPHLPGSWDSPLGVTNLMVSGRRMERRSIERYRRVRENHSDSGLYPERLRRRS
jgi:hypothetical protein